MKLEIIKHNDILFRDLLRAIAVKSIAWPHPIESQVKWIIDNMIHDDMHVFLTEDGKDKAYMTLSPVEGILNDIKTRFMGVGCVCAKERGKGDGGKLLSSVNEYLKSNGLYGLLFCKANLIKFYNRNGWQLLPNEIVTLQPQHEGVYVMVYNCNNVRSFQYSGRFF